MSIVRFIPHVNRLSKALAAPGGKRVHQALADADTLLAEVEPPCVERIDQALGEIVGINRAAMLSKAALEQVYRSADEIVGLAGLFGLADLGKAAFGLCELVDLCESEPPSGRAAIASCVRSLQLLRAGDAIDATQRAGVLDGLARLLAHVRTEAVPA